MKKLVIMMSAACAVALSGMADTETVNGIEWHYVVVDGNAVVGYEKGTAAITNSTTAA